jgi:hypothetical protein
MFEHKIKASLVSILFGFLFSVIIFSEEVLNTQDLQVVSGDIEMECDENLEVNKVDDVIEDEDNLGDKDSLKESGPEIKKNGPIDIGDLLNFNNVEDIQRALFSIIQNFHQQSAKKRVEMHEKLPEELRDDIDSVSEIYKSFISKMNALESLLFLSDKALEVVQFKKELSSVENLGKPLKGLHRIIVDGRLHCFIKERFGGNASPMSFLAGGAMGIGKMLGNLVGKEEDQETRDISEGSLEEDIKLIISSLDNFAEAPGFDEDGDVIKPIVKSIKIALQAILDKDGDVLVDLMMERVVPALESVSTRLSEIDEKCEDVSLELKKKREGLSDGEELKIIEGSVEAIKYFLNEDVRKYQRTLRTFKSIYKSSRRKTSNFNSIFKFIAYSYGACQGFFDFYMEDIRCQKRRTGAKGFAFYDGGKAITPVAGMKVSDFCDIVSVFDKQWLVPQLLNYGLSSSMALWYYFNSLGESTSGIMSGIASGDASVEELQSTQVLVYQVIAAAMASPIIINPSFWYKRPHRLVSSAGRMLQAFVYYHLFHCGAFGQNMDDNGGSLDRKMWPNDYVHIKNSILGILGETNLFVSDLILQAIWKSSDPQVLEKLENYSLNIVRPEAIKPILDVLTKVVLLEKFGVVESIVSYDKEDVFPGCAGFINYCKDKNANVGAAYAEYKAVEYIASSVGEYCGNAVAREYRKPIWEFVSGAGELIFDSLETVGIVDKESRSGISDFGEDLKSEIGLYTYAIKEFSKEVFRQGSPVKRLIVPFLLEHGFISEEEAEDNLAVNKSIMYLIFTTLATYRFLPWKDAFKFIELSNVSEVSLDRIADEAINVICKNLVGIFGGHVGSFLMGKLASSIWVNHGPFYKKMLDRGVTP